MTEAKNEILTSVENAEILKRLSIIIVDPLGIDPAKVRPEATFTDDLGADSLDMIEIGMAVEDEFGVGMQDHMPRSGEGYTVQRLIEVIAKDL